MANLMARSHDNSARALATVLETLAGAHFLATALDLCELVPVQASRPYPYGVAGALAGVEVVFGSRPGRFI